MINYILSQIRACLRTPLMTGKIRWVFLLMALCGLFGGLQPSKSLSQAYIGSAMLHAAQAAPSWALWPHEKSDLKPDKNVIFGKLPNGFRYVLMVNREPSDRVSMHLNIQAGSFHETEDQQGLAHFLEHMLFNGSTHFPPGELVKYFQRIGMQFGPDANARTGFFETVYDILLPEGDAKSLAEGLRVLKDYAEGALLLETETDRERKVILAEKRTRDSADYRTFVSSINFQFPQARVSQRLPIGVESILLSATSKDLRDYYDTWYRPEKMVLVMVGDFDADQAQELVKKTFANLIARAPRMPTPDFGIIQHEGIQPFYHYEAELGNTSISIEAMQQEEPQADSAALQRRLFLQDMADRIVKNRLDAMVRSGSAPFTSATISSGRYWQQIEYAAISADSSPDKWQDSMQTLEQMLRQTLQYGFKPSEVNRVKKDFLAELDDAVKKAPTRKSQRLARQIIRHVNNGRVFLSPQQDKELFEPVIRSATPASLHTIFQKSWAPQHRLLFVTGNARIESPNPQNIILAAFKSSQAVAVAAPTDLKAVQFPYLPEPKRMGKITSRQDIDDLGLIQIDFQNGARLNLKKTDFKANQIIFNLNFGSGRSTQPLHLPGLAQFSTAVINNSGTGTLSLNDLQRALAGKKTGLKFEVREDRFQFSGNSVSAETELMFQLLYAYLVDPGYRKEALQLVLQRFKQNHDELTRTIRGALALHGNRFLAGGDNRFGRPSLEAFQKRTLKDVRDWIGPLLTGNDLELSVVGDIDVDNIIKLAATYLGGLELAPIKPAPRRDEQVHFPVGQVLDLKVDSRLPKGMVVLAYPTDDFWKIDQTRRLSMLAEIFSDRMRVQVREKLGAAYSPYSYNWSSRAYGGFGVFRAVVEVNPAEANLIISELKQIAEGLRAAEITPEELKRALEPTLTGIKDMRRTNNYWLNSVLAGSRRYPMQLDWSRTIEKDYASISPEDIAAIAQKYLQNQKTAQIVITPGNQQADAAFRNQQAVR